MVWTVQILVSLKTAAADFGPAGDSTRPWKGVYFEAIPENCQKIREVVETRLFQKTSKHEKLNVEPSVELAHLFCCMLDTAQGP